MQDKLIYIVEDDNDILELMTYSLKANSFNVCGFTDPISFYKQLENEIPSLILLDVMLPIEDGFEVLKKLKNNKKYKDIPVIICSAKSTEINKVSGLNFGADDYLCKPFGLMELNARINAVLRRYSNSDDEEQYILKNGPLTIDTKRHAAYVNNEEITLTLKEYDLLLFFMKRLNQVIDRNQLIEYVWETDYLGETRTIDVHIGTLRKNLKEAGKLISTVRGVGYRMDEIK